MDLKRFGEPWSIWDNSLNLMEPEPELVDLSRKLREVEGPKT
jgi:hypothetical protein